MEQICEYNTENLGISCTEMFFFLMTREARKTFFNCSTTKQQFYSKMRAKKNVLEANFKTFTTHWKVDMNNVKHMQFAVDGLCESSHMALQHTSKEANCQCKSPKTNFMLFITSTRDSVAQRKQPTLQKSLRLQKIQTL